MKPVVGMVVPYFDEQCSLMVEIMKYEELNNLEIFTLKVVKKLDKDPKCDYDMDQEFTRERPIGDEKGLWGIVLDQALHG